jgi:MFS family permease
MKGNSRLSSWWPGDKIFYGWVIIAATFISAGTLVGIRFSFGVFFKSLEAEFGLSRAATSSVFSTYTLLTAVFAITSGWALDRYGPRLVVSMMGVITGLSLLITSQITSLWQIYLSYSLILAMGTGGTIPVLMSVVSRWFRRRRGFAIGIAMSGTGMGTLVMAPVTAFLISTLSWRGSYAVLGVVAWLVVIPLAMLFRRDPAQIGALPDGVKSVGGEREPVIDEKSHNVVGLSLKQAMGTRSFWLMSSVWLFYASCLHLILTHAVRNAIDTGIPAIEASTVLSVMGGFHIVSRLSAGRVSDTIGRKIPASISALFGGAALIWLIWSHDLLMFYVFAILFGISWGGLGVTTVTMVSDVFGERNLGTIMGALDMGFALGSAIGSALGGIIFDATGSYTAAFTIGAAAMFVMALFLILVRRETDTLVRA